jgi:hypothetical protein
VTVDESLPAGTVQLVIGSDYNGIGVAVTAEAPSDEGEPASNARTATDTTCIN